jgi:oligopeptide/dipeptide ABC transporter ATP-binding protein
MGEKKRILDIKNLRTYFQLYEGVVRAVDGVDMSINEGTTLGIIGESGSGKSVTAQSIMRIVPSPPGRIESGESLLYRKDGSTVDVTKISDDSAEMRSIRGREIAMIFQEPMRSFGPVHTIGAQIAEAVLIHNPGVSKREARERAIEMLGRVGIPYPEKRIDGYPHQFSGGMLQRAMIAMALSCSPRMLIADEPTTAVDVTIQAQLLELLARLRDETGMAVILITHNLAVVSEMADRIMVMYMGRSVEEASARELFEKPMHPYTRALWRSIPSIDGERHQLNPIEGSIPSPYDIPSTCYFYNRCTERIAGLCECRPNPPMREVSPGHKVACWRYTDPLVEWEEVSTHV